MWSQVAIVILIVASSVFLVLMFVIGKQSDSNARASMLFNPFWFVFYKRFPRNVRSLLMVEAILSVVGIACVVFLFRGALWSG